MDKIWRKGKGALCCVNNGLKIFWTVSRKVTQTCNLWQYSPDNNALCWKALISLSEDFSILRCLVKIALGQFFLQGFQFSSVSTIPPKLTSHISLWQYHSTKAYFSYFIMSVPFHQSLLLIFHYVSTIPSKLTSHISLCQYHSTKPYFSYFIMYVPFHQSLLLIFHYILPMVHNLGK